MFSEFDIFVTNKIAEKLCVFCRLIQRYLPTPFINPTRLPDLVEFHQFGDFFQGFGDMIEPTTKLMKSGDFGILRVNAQFHLQNSKLVNSIITLK